MSSKPQTESTTVSKGAPNYAKGLQGVVAAQTSLSLVDGEQSKLFYRGIPVHELSENSSFEETTYLLWYGKLPRAEELEKFKTSLKKHRALNPEIVDVLKSLPKEAHPMGVLRTMVSAFGLFDKEKDSFDVELAKRQALRLTAVLPSMIAASFRLREGKKLVNPAPQLSHAANFLYMMHDKKPTPDMEKALDAYLILLADHGLNASTFAARVTASTQSDLYSAVTSAVGTLKGDLHGSANQRAMELILDIGEPEKVEGYISKLLQAKQKIMGFGHRIYKKQDPRAEAFRAIARKLCEGTGNKKWIDISEAVEKYMWEKKQIPCNVDFYSASVLKVLGFPIDFFTTVFAASRVAGWTAHIVEQQSDNRLIRPGSEYLGPKDQHFIPLNKR